MPDIRNKVYTPRRDLLTGQRVFKEGGIPAAELGVGTEYTSNNLTVNMNGYTRQSYKVYPINSGGSPTVEVRVQEFVPEPGKPNDGDPANGDWVTRSDIGAVVAQPNALQEIHQQDILRWVRLSLTPITAVPTGGIRFEISGRRFG